MKCPVECAGYWNLNKLRLHEKAIELALPTPNV
jgi:hypothetical protein